MVSRPCARRVATTALLLALALVAGGAEARLDLPDPLVPGVVLEATLTVANAPARVAEVVLPTVAGLEWKLQNGRNYSTTIINGQSSTSETLRIALRAQAVEAIAIPALTVRLGDGSSLATAAVTLKPKAADANLTGEAWAELAFEPATIVPGETTTLAYRLYLRQDRPREVEKPGIEPPAGALAMGERSETKGSTTDAQGRRWKVTTWRWPLTWSQAGTYEARGQQEWFRCREDVFGRLAAESRHQLAVKPASVVVTTLPAEGRPDDYAGLVGAVTVSASLDRPRIAAGEGALLELVVGGRQAGLIGRPALQLPPGIQAYPKDDGEPAAPDERRFRWDLVPAAAGEFTIPPVGWPWFDPASRSYRRAQSGPLTLTVLPGRARELVVSGAPLAPVPAPARPVAAPVAAALELPAPLRGAAPARPGLALGLAGFALAGALGAALGLGERWRLRAPRGPHRGRALAAALAGGDLERMAAALLALRTATDPARREDVAALERAVDLARFGGQPLDDEARARARRLEGCA
jgi:hypothetical protein